MTLVTWIIRNQFGRRNLAPFTRVELALKLEPLVKEKAKENREATSTKAPRDSNGRLAPVPQNSAKPADKIDTRKELAKVAGVSHDLLTCPASDAR